MKIVLIALTTIALIGCSARKRPVVSDKFQPENEPRHVHYLIQAHAAAGARANSTLVPLHFDGKHLNSLGEEMIGLMMVDRHEDEPIVVYLDLKKSEAATGAQRESVSNYLITAGVAEKSIEIRDGANPALSTPSAPALARFPKTESGSLNDRGGSSNSQTNSSSSK